jgi:hypothetical protein
MHDDRDLPDGDVESFDAGHVTARRQALGTGRALRRQRRVVEGEPRPGECRSEVGVKARCHVPRR